VSEPYAVLDWLPDATVVVGGDGRIRHANTAAARLLEADAAALAGRPVSDVLRLADDEGREWWALARPFDADARLLPRMPETDLRLRTPSGRQRPVTVTAARRRGDGGIETLVLSLRRAERRHRLDAARSDLVSTVSHEIRSPLTSVKGFVKTLLAKWERFTDDQKRQMLATVNEDADRVTRLLGELLDVSRIDAGRLQLHRQMVDVAAVARRVAERLDVGDESRVRVRLDDDELPKLYSDPDKLEQIFTNLIENALKYAEGEIVVTAAVDDDSVRFTLADEGPGIAAAHLVNIFGKFFRPAGERRTGTGLGLYITKGIVQAHGGRIWAESTPGEGSRFHFTLPRGGLELAGIDVPSRR
jgi:signal transduction histidine kinase